MWHIPFDHQNGHDPLIPARFIPQHITWTPQSRLSWPWASTPVGTFCSLCPTSGCVQGSLVLQGCLLSCGVGVEMEVVAVTAEGSSSVPGSIPWEGKVFPWSCRLSSGSIQLWKLPPYGQQWQGVHHYPIQSGIHSWGTHSCGRGYSPGWGNMAHMCNIHWLSHHLLLLYLKFILFCCKGTISSWRMAEYSTEHSFITMNDGEILHRQHGFLIVKDTEVLGFHHMVSAVCFTKHSFITVNGWEVLHWTQSIAAFPISDSGQFCACHILSSVNSIIVNC